MSWCWKLLKSLYSHNSLCKLTSGECLTRSGLIALKALVFVRVTPPPAYEQIASNAFRGVTQQKVLSCRWGGGAGAQFVREQVMCVYATTALSQLRFLSAPLWHISGPPKQQFRDISRLLPLDWSRFVIVLAAWVWGHKKVTQHKFFKSRL